MPIGNTQGRSGKQITGFACTPPESGMRYWNQSQGLNLIIRLRNNEQIPDGVSVNFCNL